MHHGRPVERSGHFPARVAHPVAGDLHHSRDQFIVPDAPIVGAGDSAKLGSPVLGFQRLHLLGAVRQQAVLEVDRRQRGRKVAEVAGRRTHQRGQLTKRPVCWRDGRRPTRQRQRHPAHVVRPRFHTDGAGLNRAGDSPLGSSPDRCIERAERQITLIIRPRKPFRRYALDALAARDIDLEAALPPGCGILNLKHENLHRRPRQSLSLALPDRHPIPASLSLSLHFSRAAGGQRLRVRRVAKDFTSECLVLARSSAP